MAAGNSLSAAAAAPLGTCWTQVVSSPVLFADAPRLPPPPSPSSSSPGSRSAVNVSSSSAFSPAAGGMRIEGLGTSKGGGPAFVGQVFSMCDPSGSGLMAVTTHVQIPFLTSRTPKWIKRLVNVVAKNEEEGGPVFRFFMDLSDAVSYVKKLNVPTGMVGACRLDVAFEHFKEKPHMFQFVPNEKQVKEANKLLKTVSVTSRFRKMSGVPVFTAQNLNIAIATSDGVKWYTPYFFDKGLLDNILEASIDQHFQTLIQNRHMQRRRDVIDDSFSSDVVDDLSENIFEPPEIHEMMDEVGHPSIPLSVLSKAAEIKFLDVIDKAVLGNRWLRKATGIQPKFPYMVDSFEERTTASVSKTKDLAFSAVNAEEKFRDSRDEWKLSRVSDGVGCSEGIHLREKGFQFPFGGWSPRSWMKLAGVGKCQCNEMESSTRSTSKDMSKVLSNPLLPRITMVGISTSDGAPMSKSNLRKTMEDLTKELEQPNQQVNELNKDMDPLFVANVGDYSTLTKSRSM